MKLNLGAENWNSIFKKKIKESLENEYFMSVVTENYLVDLMILSGEYELRIV